MSSSKLPPKSSSKLPPKSISNLPSKSLTKSQYDRYKKYIKKLCEFNKDQDIIIYHFTKSILRPEPKLKYYNISSENSIYDTLSNAIELCDKNNILIIIESEYFNTITDILNDIIASFSTEMSLKNITIINFTKNTEKVIYKIPQSKIFKKIINVFPNNQKIALNDPDFFPDKTPPNKNIETTTNTQLKSKYTISFGKTVGGSLEKVLIRLMDTDTKSNNVKDSWWYKWYFGVPSCADVRLSQSTGTCWLNATINSIFLISSLVSRIKNNHDMNKKIISLKDFTNAPHTLDTMIHSLVRHLLINKEKAQQTDGNFVGALASKIKCVYESKPQPFCENIAYGDGGSSFPAIKIIFEHTLKPQDYVCISVQQQTYENYKNSIATKNKLNATLTKEYNDYVKLYNQSNDQKSLESELNRKKKLLDEIDITMDPIIKYNLKKYNMVTEKNKELITKMDNINTPDILVFGNDFSSVPRETIFNGAKYVLNSATISINIEHAICGIICNGKSYVYDSNNIIVECDGWAEGNIEPYLKNDATIKLYNNNKIKLDGINAAIYSKLVF